MDAPDFANSPLRFAPPPPAFDDLIAGDNCEILSAARALAKGDSAALSLYIWGGGGKTALLRAAATTARKTMSAFYVGGGRDIPPPMPGFLAADDVEKLSAENRLLLFDWQNKIRPGANYRIFAAASSPPTKAGLGEEIAARFCAGLVFRLRDISESDKRQALKKFARRRGFSPPERVLNLLLSRLPRDMTSLTFALSDLDEFLLAREMPLTSQSANKWLRLRLAGLFDSPQKLQT